MTVSATRVETDRLLAVLRTAWARVGDGVAPADTTLPYAVLYPAGSGLLDGPSSDPHADRPGLYQITCVGGTREQAEALADLLRPVALGLSGITGRKVMQAWLETSQPVRRDDSTDPPLYYAADQVRVLTTPT